MALLVFTCTTGLAAPALGASGEPDAVLVESFDTTASDWVSVGRGAATLSDGSDTTQGEGALRLAYDVTKSYAEFERKTTPSVIATDPISSLRVDLKGDGTYNTVYLKLRDATGEYLMYRVDAMATTSWTDVDVDLTQKPAQHELGNNDGVIDYPLTLARILVARNGNQPATGVATLDNLRSVSDGWSLPRASSERFSPSAGQTVSLYFVAGSPGDFELKLSDQMGRSRVFSGTASSASTVAFEWDGRDESGNSLEGSVAAQLIHDGTADRSIGTSRVVGKAAHLVGVSQRASVDSPVSIVGVNSTLTTLDSPREVDWQAGLMEDAFVRYAREEFDWNRIEPRKGYFDWAKFDQAVNASFSRNVEVVGKLVYSADWASSAPAGTPRADRPYFPPSNTADYTDYVSAVVERYKDKVHVWEIWNEPDTSTYWKPRPNASAYAEMLAAAYAVIKATDPEATVLVGGLAGFPESFMQSVVDAGGRSGFDGIALHTYSNLRPESGMAETYLDAASAFLTRNKLDRSLWITEVGWTTCVECAGATTEQAQASYLSRTFVAAAARDVKGVMWYSLVTSGVSRTSRLDNFGLVERSGRIKLAYGALQDVGAVLNAARGAGVAASQAGGGNAVVSDFATTTGLSASGLSGGWVALTSGSGRWSGLGGLRLSYDFSGPSRGATISMSQQLPLEPSSISLWVYGDGSNSPVYLEFSDASGERYSALLGHAAEDKWTKLTLYSDGANPQYTFAGGDGNGRWNYPLRVTGISLYEATSGKSSGTVFFDDLSVGYGPAVRGAVLHGSGGNIQALYSLGATAQTSVAIPDSDAVLRRATGDTNLRVIGARASVTLSASPVYVVSSVGVAPTSGRSGSNFVASWVGGNTYYATAQVYGPNGFARTLFYTKRFSAGVRSAYWDGRSADGALARPGEYIYRIWLHGEDGETTMMSRRFVVAAN